MPAPGGKINRPKLGGGKPRRRGRRGTEEKRGGGNRGEGREPRREEGRRRGTEERGGEEGNRGERRGTELRGNLCKRRRVLSREKRKRHLITGHIMDAGSHQASPEEEECGRQ
ncbi:hypothetical protein F7725_022156 [Dissostichus mawsoni]|uniref:Uncharacterized protein n=1 Tax=Dissostichus mawsoni TaxID=36200 RepID=A0A7J5ZGK1_DISMA|nr:hypothetical protein F7725_022156 [Dissostichus mawsoni]